MTIEQLNKVVVGAVNVLGAYADPKNWQATGETKDVRTDQNVVVGVEQVHTWVGPGSGPDLANHTLKRILGVPVKPANPVTEEAK